MAVSVSVHSIVSFDPFANTDLKGIWDRHRHGPFVAVYSL